jgi:hypothetical protein
MDGPGRHPEDDREDPGSSRCDTGDVLARVFFLAFDPRGVFCFGNVSDLLCESSLRVVGCVYALLHVYLCSMNLVGRGDLLI